MPRATEKQTGKVPQTLVSTHGIAWPGAPASTIIEAVKIVLSGQFPTVNFRSIPVSIAVSETSALIEWEDGPLRQEVAQACLTVLDESHHIVGNGMSIRSHPHPDAILFLRTGSIRTRLSTLLFLARNDEQLPIKDSGEAALWAKQAVIEAEEAIDATPWPEHETFEENDVLLDALVSTAKPNRNRTETTWLRKIGERLAQMPARQLAAPK